jgi:flavodoxin
MRILIGFYSETGNTEKVAKAIFEEVSKQHKAELKKVDKIIPNTMNDYDVDFLGSPCHSSDLAKPVKKILTALPSSPRFKLVGFFTHSTHTAEGNERQQKLFRRWASNCITSFQEISAEKKIDFMGYFNCQGAPSPPIKKFINREIVTSPDEWKEYSEEVMKHPTPEDLQKARKFAKEIMKKANE